MNLREVREKAADQVLGRFGCHRADCRDLAKYILATIDTEPELPITAEWLREEWGFEDKNLQQMKFIELIGREVYMLPHNEGWDCFGEDDFEWPVVITARQQFCDLARCLGIQQRKDGAK